MAKPRFRIICRSLPAAAVLALAWTAAGLGSEAGYAPLQYAAAVESTKAALDDPSALRQALERINAAREAGRSRPGADRARLHSALGLLYSILLEPAYEVDAGGAASTVMIAEYAEVEFAAALTAAAGVSARAEADAGFFAGVGLHLMRNTALAAGDHETAAEFHARSKQHLQWALMKGTGISEARELYRSVRNLGEITPMAYVHVDQGLKLVRALMDLEPRPAPPPVRERVEEAPPPAETRRPPPEAEPAHEDRQWGFRITPPDSSWEVKRGPFPEPVRFSMERHEPGASGPRPNLMVSVTTLEPGAAGAGPDPYLDNSRRRFEAAGADVIRRRELELGGRRAAELIFVTGDIMQTLTALMAHDRLYVITGTAARADFEDAYSGFRKAVESFDAF